MASKTIYDGWCEVMEKLLAEVRAEMLNELNRAEMKYGRKHNSPHEAYGVLKEEYEEAIEEAESLYNSINAFWEKVKHDQCADLELEDIRKNAIHLAAEAIQTAAMAEKALRGYDWQS